MAEPANVSSTAADAAAESRRTATVVFRCAPCLAFWAVVAAALVCAIPLLDLGIEAAVAALIVAVYCLQALLMDLPGVRVDGSSVRGPFRPWPEIPVAVFGRRKIGFDHIERIVIMHGIGPVHPAAVRTKTRTSCGLAFSSKAARRAFYRRVTDLRVSIPIVKST